MLAEPDVALTDFTLCLLGIFFAYRLNAKGGRAAGCGDAIGFFLALAAASFLGGLVHGFFAVDGTTGNTLLWTLTMLVMGVVSLFSWRLAGVVLRIKNGLYKHAGSLLFAVYAGTIVFVRKDFVVALIALGITSVLLLAGFVFKLLRERRGAWLYGIAAIVLNALASVLQQLGVGLHPVYFNHNALYHVIGAIALVLFYRQFLYLLEQKQETLVTP